MDKPENKNYSILISQITGGNKNAFESLFHIFYNRLCRFAVLIVKTQELAEEIVLDVFLNIWNNKEGLKNVKNIRSYLYISVKNRSLNYLNKKFHSHSHVNLDSVNIEIGSCEATPEMQFISQEVVDQINKAVEHLPTRCKLIFKLIREDHLKYKEVAELLGISVNTIDNQMAIALKKIAEELNIDLKKTITKNNLLSFLLSVSVL